MTSSDYSELAACLMYTWVQPRWVQPCSDCDQMHQKPGWVTPEIASEIQWEQLHVTTQAVMLHKQWCFMVVCNDHWWLIDGLYWWWSVHQPLRTWNKQPPKKPGAMVRPLSQPSKVESRAVHIHGVPTILRHQGRLPNGVNHNSSGAAPPTGLILLIYEPL